MSEQGCDCDHGWRQVSATYAARLAPDTPAELWWSLGADERADRQVAQTALRASLADSWYPCKRCRAVEFGRWLARVQGRDLPEKLATDVGHERRDIA